MVATAASAVHLPAALVPVRVARAPVVVACAAAAAGVSTSATADALKPPPSKNEMLSQAAAAVKRAQDDGVARCTLRLFLPRGEDENLVPPDESWQGGIMQLYSACTPLAQDLLRRLSTEVAGVPPALSEQRLDESGVDGESMWFAQSKQAKDDAYALVQPSSERLETIRKMSADAGDRLLMLVNPQWKERDDPLDALSRKGGLIGALGNFMGGKAALEAELKSSGFVDVYTLAEYVCRGSRICLQLSYPYGWTASYRNPDTEGWVPLFSGAEARPTYQEVEEALVAANVPFRFTEFDNVV